MPQPVSEREAIQNLAEAVFAHCRRCLEESSIENTTIDVRLGFLSSKAEAMHFLESDTLDMWVLLQFFGYASRAPDPETVALLLIHQFDPETEIRDVPIPPDAETQQGLAHRSQRARKGALLAQYWVPGLDDFTEEFWLDRRSVREVLTELARQAWDLIGQGVTDYAIDIQAEPDGWRVSFYEAVG